MPVHMGVYPPHTSTDKPDTHLAGQTCGFKSSLRSLRSLRLSGELSVQFAHMRNGSILRAGLDKIGPALRPFPVRVRVRMGNGDTCPPVCVAESPFVFL